MLVPIKYDVQKLRKIENLIKLCDFVMQAPHLQIQSKISETVLYARKLYSLKGILIGHYAKASAATHAHGARRHCGTHWH
jgi:hypothetical protein